MATDSPEQSVTEQAFPEQAFPEQSPSPMRPGRFVGKVALITGANRHGIGGAIARRLAEEGAAVGLLCRGEPTELIDQLAEHDHGILWSDCDVRSMEDIDAARDACLEQFGKIDVVVNNAGIETPGPFEEMTDEDWQQLVDVNLTGVARVSRSMLRPLRANGGGVIVNISSASSFGGTPGLVAYSATKAGVNGLTQSLAIEVAEQGVRVVGVAPALVRTPMAARHIRSLTADDWDTIQRAHPLGIGVAQDVASTVAFLASDEAGWISGVTLPLGWMPSYPLPRFAE